MQGLLMIIDGPDGVLLDAKHRRVYGTSRCTEYNVGLLAAQDH